MTTTNYKEYRIEDVSAVVDTAAFHVYNAHGQTLYSACPSAETDGTYKIGKTWLPSDGVIRRWIDLGCQLNCFAEPTVWASSEDEAMPQLLAVLAQPPQMKTWPKTEITPVSAVGELISILTLFQYYAKEIAGVSRNMQCAQSAPYAQYDIKTLYTLISIVTPMLAGAKIVIWEPALWRVATNGAEEAFAALIPDVADYTTTPQYWSFSGGESFGSMPESVVSGMFILPSKPIIDIITQVDQATGLLFEEREGVCVIYVVAPHDYDPRRPVETALPRVSFDFGLWAGLPITANAARYIAAQRFMENRCVKRMPYSLNHKERKPFKRTGAAIPEVCILRIRRPQAHEKRAEGPHEPLQIDWGCSWWVAPHWRRNPHDPSKPIRVNGPYGLGYRK